MALVIISWSLVRSNAPERQHPEGQSAAESTAPTPTPTVLIAPVVSQRLNSRTLLPGELQAYQDVALYPKVQGFVDWIEVDRGSVVKEGQLLVRLVAPELTAHRQEATAKVQAAQAQRLEAEAKLAADEATYRRLKAASATPGVISGNDVDVAQKTVEADRARVHAGQENENATLQAARAVQDVESYLRITAPFDGIITERNVHKGSLVGPSGGPLAPPMLRIQQVSSLRLIVAIPEAEAESIEQGTEVQFTVPAFPGETFTGVVQRVAHAVDVKTRTMPVELDVANPSGRLAPGMYADVVWLTHRPQPSLFVPSSAVARTTERTFVIRIRDGVTEWVDVKRGEVMGDMVEVFGNLEQGDQVAVRGTDELRAGTHVVAKQVSAPS
ncbi:MAG TPA: efflux RND transporter periplasmic adaptor subunit [Candidatus Binatia bacterium]|nr:efflux RND transporter periplasmic adaptor subunit [Candidatus Binatia bacterium]